MIGLFIFVAVVTFFAFAFLFFNTAMSSLEDHRRLFVRVYAMMMVVLAVGTFFLSSKAVAADWTPKEVKAHSLSPYYKKENGHV